MRTSVAFIAAPYGFGPSAKAIAISSYLPRSLDRVFVGQGPPLEMAELSKEFTSCHHLDFGASAIAAARTLSQFDVLVFINTNRFISRLVVASRPAILVETLAWLRNEPPACAPVLKSFFAQRFFSHPFAPSVELLANFHAVGPIMPKSMAGSVQKPTELGLQSPILHCGGLFSPSSVDGASEEFLFQTLNALMHFSGTFRAIVPPNLHSAVHAAFGDRISLVECSSLSVHDHIRGAEFAITTSGIEFSYESMMMGVPTLFLPPFNASQFYQIQYHSKLNRNSVSFDAATTPCTPFDKLHEGTADLQKAGMRGVWQGQFEQVARFLRNLGAERRGTLLPEVRRQQHRELSGIGKNGAKSIASAVLREVGAVA